jgi:DNA-binding beta-propeller fold protein YncE
VYVTATEDNTVFAFDVRPVRNGLEPTVLFKSGVSTGPFDSGTIDQGRRLVVVSSNDAPGTVTPATSTPQELTILDAVTGAPQTTIPAGVGPRRMAVTKDGRTLLVANRESGTLVVVDLERLPSTR